MDRAIDSDFKPPKSHFGKYVSQFTKVESIDSHFKPPKSHFGKYVWQSTKKTIINGKNQYLNNTIQNSEISRKS